MKGPVTCLITHHSIFHAKPRHFASYPGLPVWLLTVTVSALQPKKTLNRETMVGILNTIPQPTVFRQFSLRKPLKTRLPVKVTSEYSKTPVGPVSTSTKEDSNPAFTAPPNFKPPQPKRFAVRPDKVLDIVGASLSLIFRLGTGVFVSGYWNYSLAFLFSWWVFCCICLVTAKLIGKNGRNCRC